MLIKTFLSVPHKAIPKEELVACVPHLYSNLEDRNADVRKNAGEAVLGIMIHLGMCLIMFLVSVENLIFDS